MALMMQLIYRCPVIFNKEKHEHK